MPALRELLVSFQVDLETGNLAAGLANVNNASQQLGQVANHANSLGDTASSFKKFAGYVAGAFAVHAITGFIEGQIAAGSAVEDLSSRLGVSGDDLQRFQFASKLVGVSGEEAALGLKFLNKAIGTAVLDGGEAAQSFAKLGVEFKGSDGKARDVNATMLDLADKFQGLDSDAERTAYAMKFFGRSGASLIPILKGGRTELEATFKKFNQLGGGLRKDFVAAADKAGDQIDTLGLAFKGLQSRIAVQILPALTQVVEFLQPIIAGFAAMIDHSNILQVTFVALALGGLAYLVIEFGLVALGVAAVAIVFAALILIAEDLYTWFEGGDSAIGKFLQSMFGFSTADTLLQDFRATVAECDANVALLLNSFGVQLPEGASAAGTVIKYALLGALVVITKVIEAVSFLAEKLAHVIEGFAAIKDNVGAFGLGGTLRIAENNSGFTDSTAGRSLDALSSILGSVVGSEGSRPANNGVHQNNSVVVNVQGGPGMVDGVRSAIGDGLTSSFEAAQAALGR